MVSGSFLISEQDSGYAGRGLLCRVVWTGNGISDDSLDPYARLCAFFALVNTVLFSIVAHQAYPICRENQT